MPKPIRARFFASADDLRSWFEAHHADREEVWVGFSKADTGRRGIVYAEAVEQAVSFGWIDSTVRRIDDERYANRFTPRRPDSSWTDGNRRLFRELESAGRVHAAGRAAFEGRAGPVRGAARRRRQSTPRSR